MQLTLNDAISRFGVDVLDHLDRQVEIPTISKAGRQGDVLIVRAAVRTPAVTSVPASGGCAVVRGENGGNTHLLLAEGPVCYDARPVSARNLTLGTLTVSEGAVAYLTHPEHGYLAFAPGTYRMYRQREQADELRLVAD